jgi:hypothetical protein
MAREQYFFWVSLTVSIFRGFIFAIRILDNLKDLPVSDVCATDNAEHRKNGYKYTSGAQPLIDIQADKKTKADAPDHCQAQLHHNGQVFGPGTILFVIKIHHRVP